MRTTTVNLNIFNAQTLLLIAAKVVSGLVGAQIVSLTKPAQWSLFPKVFPEATEASQSLATKLMVVRRLAALRTVSMTRQYLAAVLQSGGLTVTFILNLLFVFPAQQTTVANNSFLSATRSISIFVIRAMALGYVSTSSTPTETVL
ncbi:hypothetical protein [Endozoicomonas sp. ISHI1]|uniref:hypothetical protein n=1 Tax=Endozoicomonas sp. ISHI1 TaxID=2825882 RepID=UPI0021494C82|nr:hypothetical protein [Endozoicomonas sp. ISHI1]